jgi:hypothetical protein
MEEEGGRGKRIRSAAVRFAPPLPPPTAAKRSKKVVTHCKASSLTAKHRLPPAAECDALQ